MLLVKVKFLYQSRRCRYKNVIIDFVEFFDKLLFGAARRSLCVKRLDIKDSASQHITGQQRLAVN